MELSVLAGQRSHPLPLCWLQLHQAKSLACLPQCNLQLHHGIRGSVLIIGPSLLCKGRSDILGASDPVCKKASFIKTGQGYIDEVFKIKDYTTSC